MMQKEEESHMQSVENRRVEKSWWRSINKVRSIAPVGVCGCVSECSCHAATFQEKH